jgi:hypothetical protein
MTAAIAKAARDRPGALMSQGNWPLSKIAANRSEGFC